MPFPTSIRGGRWAAGIGVCAILIAAAAARMWNLSFGVPFAVGIDEPQVVDRALRILRSGDWNTHLFDYPTLVIYLQAVVDIVRFLWGAINGEWASLDGFTMAAVYGTGRFVAASIGVLTVWIVYRLGTAIADRRVGLLAAVALAVNPLHVRESHFILTDVPMAALTTLATWLAIRAGRLGTVRAYGWAGAACGLAAAAKYTGGIALVAVAAAWAVYQRAAANRARLALAAMVSAAVAFLIAAPYTLLDLPEFLDGFAAQFSRFARAPNAESAARLYLKHLSMGEWWWLPLAAIGIATLLASRRTRPRAVPMVAFSASFFYVLSSHAHVFARYAMPLVPMLCISAAAAVVAGLDALAPRLTTGRRRLAAGAVAILIVALAPLIETVAWLKATRRPDTRSLAAEWLKASAPKGTRLAVENSGPTYLSAAGFKVTTVELLPDQPIAFYRERADYLVITSVDLGAYTPYLSAGSIVFEVAPGPRWGPPVRVVKLAPAVPK